ncbi:MAG: 16S rRNA (cytosine(967)-C(5))-methyltransferase RsmB [Candidatus Accumulibacter sp.]|nr:16S rRNA (cytosine(967)-C(5))-methyltransferase RsmB [Accumulibacter sp.]
MATDSLGYSLLLAARVLAVVHGGKSLNGALLLLTGVPAAARAAAQDVIYGVLRAYGRGEFFLGRLMAKPLTHAETQVLLLAALYRLETRFEAAPMVVDQAVAAAGELADGALKGVVNGVLRSFLRQRERLLMELRQDDAAYFQHPAWWLARLRRAYPEDWSGIVAAGNAPPPMTLRVNARRISASDYLGVLRTAGIAAEAVGIAGLRLATPLPVDRLPGFAEGWVSVQDAGAQRAAEWLDPADGDCVLDACAAPGGKTAHLLERAGAEVLALDIDAARAPRIEANLKRLGLTARALAADCLEPDKWWDGRRFDAILADAPCSGSGVARRHPDIKLLRRESDIRKLARVQSAILDALWPLLKSGGKLLYATCSVFVEENAAQIDAFLVRQTDARRAGQELWLPNPEHDGFYYALLRKA